jgi:hypothetical protein
MKCYEMTSFEVTSPLKTTNVEGRRSAAMCKYECILQNVTLWVWEGEEATPAKTNEDIRVKSRNQQVQSKQTRDETTERGNDGNLCHADSFCRAKKCHLQESGLPCL